MSGPFTTTVADVLYMPNGTPVSNGTLTVSNNQTFITGDSIGYTILNGFSIDVQVINGAFSVNLIPNENTTPATEYAVEVRCTEGYFTQFWSVPRSDTPVTLAEVVVE
jgi:hypothetical protein